MRGNRRAGTKPEARLRSALHARGMRFRKDAIVRYPGGRVRADIVFSRARVVVFVDGCFWHACPDHGTQPGRNREYWQAKFARNCARDRANDEGLQSEGWTVLRLWEHEPLETAIAIVCATLGREVET